MRENFLGLSPTQMPGSPPRTPGKPGVTHLNLSWVEQSFSTRMLAARDADTEAASNRAQPTWSDISTQVPCMCMRASMSSGFPVLAAVRQDYFCVVLVLDERTPVRWHSAWLGRVRLRRTRKSGHRVSSGVPYRTAASQGTLWLSAFACILQLSINRDGTN